MELGRKELQLKLFLVIEMVPFVEDLKHFWDTLWGLCSYTRGVLTGGNNNKVTNQTILANVVVLSMIGRKNFKHL